MKVYGRDRTRVEAFKMVDFLIKSKAGRFYDDVLYEVTKQSGLSEKAISKYIDDSIEVGLFHKDKGGCMFWGLENERKDLYKNDDGNLEQDNKTPEDLLRGLQDSKPSA